MKMRAPGWFPIRFFGAAIAAAFCLGCFAKNIQDFTVQAPDGSPRSFSALKGETTVVIFLATRCPVSNAYNERMIQAYKDYSPKGVKFIFINANQNEPPAEVLEHAKRVGFSFPVYRDPGNAAADRFGAQATPETYVIDRSGAIRYHGAIDDSQNPARVHERGLRLALDAVLAGKEVANPETKAFGCTIKRVRGIR
ncbi:MAG: redoxin domain-containing protein [Bryobacteraceae bacterium]